MAEKAVSVALLLSRGEKTKGESQPSLNQNEIKKMMRSLFVTMCLLVSMLADGHDMADSVAVKCDSISSVHINKLKRQRTPLFEGLSLGADIVGIVMDRVTDKGEYQAFLQANIKGKYLPVLELGYGKADKCDDNTGVKYKAKAPFGRLGCDFNILKNKHDNYRLVVGVRYGFTKFDFDTLTPVSDESGGGETPPAGETPDAGASARAAFASRAGESVPVTDPVLTSDKMTLHWAELVFGVDAKIWGPLHMGWTLRMRRKISASDTAKPALYAPGYGDVSQGSRFMALYTVSLEI